MILHAQLSNSFSSSSERVYAHPFQLLRDIILGIPHSHQTLPLLTPYHTSPPVAWQVSVEIRVRNFRVRPHRLPQHQHIHLPDRVVKPVVFPHPHYRSLAGILRTTWLRCASYSNAAYTTTRVHAQIRCRGGDQYGCVNGTFREHAVTDFSWGPTRNHSSRKSKQQQQT